MFGALKRCRFRSLASLILVVNVVGELQQKRTLAAARGFLAAARLSCFSVADEVWTCVFRICDTHLQWGTAVLFLTHYMDYNSLNDLKTSLSRSPKGQVVRYATHDFLLVIHGNYVFPNTANHRPKIANFAHPLLHYHADLRQFFAESPQIWQEYS